MLTPNPRELVPWANSSHTFCCFSDAAPVQTKLCSFMPCPHRSVCIPGLRNNSFCELPLRPHFAASTSVQNTCQSSSDDQPDSVRLLRTHADTLTPPLSLQDMPTNRLPLAERPCSEPQSHVRSSPSVCACRSGTFITHQHIMRSCWYICGSRRDVDSQAVGEHAQPNGQGWWALEAGMHACTGEVAH